MRDTGYKHIDGKPIMEGDVVTSMKGNIPHTGTIIWDCGFMNEYNWWHKDEKTLSQELLEHAVKYLVPNPVL